MATNAGPIQEGPYITLVAAEALGPGARVKLDSNGKAALAGLADAAIGYVDYRGAASGALATIAAAAYPAMVYMIAHAALDIGDQVWSQASGRVDDNTAATAFRVGYTIDAAGAQDDVVRVIRCETTAEHA